MKKETEYIIQLIVKRLQGGLSPEEETFFAAWKSRSKANEELYERLENEYKEHTEYPLYVVAVCHERHSEETFHSTLVSWCCCDCHRVIECIFLSDVFDGR